MAIRNTPHDAANTAVRAFLTSVGEKKLGKKYDKKRTEWKEDVLNFFKVGDVIHCAYCNEKTDKPLMEHLKMISRSQCGIHHPSNTVPICSKCNSRERKTIFWEEHIKSIWKNDEIKIKEKIEEIQKFMNKYGYIRLSENEIVKFKRLKSKKAKEELKKVVYKEKVSKEKFRDIRQHFNNKCAYCNKEDNSEKDNILRINWIDCGYEHPGNQLPVCLECKEKRNSKEHHYLEWYEQLERICYKRGEESKFEKRKEKINQHINRYRLYINEEEYECLKKTAKVLYKSVEELVTKTSKTI